MDGALPMKWRLRRHNFPNGVYMSTSTATQMSTTASVTPTDNRFELHDHEHRTTVTLNLDASGPLISGTTPQAPTMQYQGEEGKFTFAGEQLVKQSTALGTMYTVMLNVVPDLRTLYFSLLLPDVIHAAGATSQSFHTIAIKSEKHTSLQGIPNVTGGNPTYTVMKMSGNASKVKNAL
jgi:hypothetical protein